MWKMKLLALCFILATYVLGANQHANANVAVGLYAPDRYDGIPDMCLMPMDFGYCRAKVKRYYFDMRRMKCTMFYWGGCAGNVNNFKSMEECNKVCLDAYEDNYTSNENTNNNSNNNSNTRTSSGYVKSSTKAAGTGGSVQRNDNYGSPASNKNFKISKSYLNRGSTSSEREKETSGEDYEE